MQRLGFLFNQNQPLDVMYNTNEQIFEANVNSEVNSMWRTLPYGEQLFEVPMVSPMGLCHINLMPKITA